MSEFFPDTGELSNPQQAQRIVDLVKALEGRDLNHDNVRWFQATVDELPRLVAARLPAGIIAGNSRHPLTFDLYEAEEAQRLQGRVGKLSEWRMVDSESAEDINDCYYDVRAEHDLYSSDADFWPYLQYQQVANITLTQNKTFNDLPVKLASQIDYTVWRSKEGAMFMHREVFPSVDLTVEGELMWEEEVRRHALDMQIEEMELGEDSLPARMMNIINELELDKEAKKEVQEEDLADDVERDKQASIAAQNNMLLDRSRGEGVVDVDEARSLIGLLEQLDKAA